VEGCRQCRPCSVRRSLCIRAGTPTVPLAAIRQAPCNVATTRNVAAACNKCNDAATCNVASNLQTCHVAACSMRPFGSFVRAGTPAAASTITPHNAAARRTPYGRRCMLNHSAMHVARRMAWCLFYGACCTLSVGRRTCTPVEMSSACITFQSSTAVPPSSLKAAQLSLTASPSSLRQVDCQQTAGRRPYSRHGPHANGSMHSAFTWAACDTHQMPLWANTNSHERKARRA
jgi:hypothetical protein